MLSLVTTHAQLHYVLFSFQYFAGNRDQNTVVQYRFYPPIKALFIKIRPWGWYSRISMRVEFFGCSEGKKKKKEKHLIIVNCFSLVFISLGREI